MSETKPKTETCPHHGPRCAKTMCGAARALTDLIDRVGIEETTRRLQASLKPETELSDGEADTMTRVMGGGL